MKQPLSEIAGLSGATMTVFILMHMCTVLVCTFYLIHPRIVSVCVSNTHYYWFSSCEGLWEVGANGIVAKLLVWGYDSWQERRGANGWSTN